MVRRTIEGEIAQLEQLISQAEGLLREARRQCWHMGGIGLPIIPLARLAGSLERLFKEFRSRRDFLQTIQRLYY